MKDSVANIVSLFENIEKVFPVSELKAKINEVQNTLGIILSEEEIDVAYKKIITAWFERKNIASESPAIISATPEIDHSRWFSEGKKNNQQERWRFLAGNILIENTKKVGEEAANKILASIDTASDRILDYLPNPKQIAFKGKGLVVGYVQSGKTANFTAVTAKAADSGYKLIVILAGIHNNLRKQSQERLDAQLGITGSEVSHLWHPLTNPVQDFPKKMVSLLDNMQSQSNMIFLIIKKNVSILQNFKNWLQKSQRNTTESFPLLMIDDEADQASPDITVKNPDTDPSRTNSLIRSILNLFPRSAYLAYTATPYANVLIDLRNEDDLFPSDFIISLPKPEGYLGASEIFASAKAEVYFQPVNDDVDDDVIISEDMYNSVYSHIVAATARIKKDQQAYTSMLIHDNRLKQRHQELFQELHEHISKLKTSLNSFQDYFKKAYDSVYSNLPESAGVQKICFSFEDIWKTLPELLDHLRVIKVNSDGDELNYTQDHHVIAIGGDKLSRGLTLEGLITSYYTRESKQYDTLLQMGRWFGFRNNYEHLIRIFTTYEIVDRFKHLASVEEEMRDEIVRFEDEGRTPSEFPIRIKAHNQMKITSPAKIGPHVHVVQGSYSDDTVQNIWMLFDDINKLRHNLDLFLTLIKSIGKAEEVQGMYFWKEIEFEKILTLLKGYNFYDKNANISLDPHDLVKYMQNTKQELAKWFVFLPSISAKESYKIETAVGKIGMVNRAKHRGTSKIGVISSPDHFEKAKEIMNGTDAPALFLYFISKFSKPKKDNEQGRLEPLFDEPEQGVDIASFAIKFPKSKIQSEIYIGQSI